MQALAIIRIRFILKQLWVVIVFLGIHCHTAMAQRPKKLISTDSVTLQKTESLPAHDTQKTKTTAKEHTVGADVASDTLAQEKSKNKPSFHQIIKEKFIEGGWEFMSILLLCFIIGLTLVIERIIILNLATINTTKLLKKVEHTLLHDGIEATKAICKNTRGPVASLFTQGLIRLGEGIDMAEKSMTAYGTVETSKLERGLVWVSLLISLAPMLGFMGTVVGMIQAFDAIEAAGDLSPSLVAGGIKVALLTTVGGLIIAVILQVFYNYLTAKIDAIVTQMEDSAIAFVDLLVKHRVQIMKTQKAQKHTWPKYFYKNTNETD